MQFAELSAEHSAYRPVMQRAYPARVKKIDSPRQIRRRERLKALLRDNGGASEVAQLTGTPKSHFSAIVHGSRGMGDALAAKLERHYGKPSGWFDQDASEWPFTPELTLALRQVGKRDVVKMENQMRAALEMPPLPLPNDEAPPEPSPPPEPPADSASSKRVRSSGLVDQEAVADRAQKKRRGSSRKSA